MPEMYSNDFEAAFSDFLDRREYDEAEHYLFSMMRLAFTAGWLAAGGSPMQPEAVFTLIPGGGQSQKSPATERDHKNRR